MIESGAESELIIHRGWYDSVQMHLTSINTNSEEQAAKITRPGLGYDEFHFAHCTQVKLNKHLEWLAPFIRLHFPSRISCYF